METSFYPAYLCNPEQIKVALQYLDDNCLSQDFEQLFSNFKSQLKITNVDEFPITFIKVGGRLCRARINDHDFKIASHISEIGINYQNQAQGRANSKGYHTFYGANDISTAAFEVLQDKPSGVYTVTIGCWTPEKELRLANLIDRDNPDFKNLAFAESFPNRYLANWPEDPKLSTMLLNDYACKLFKKISARGLYSKTNIIASMCFSLRGVDGLAYATSSNSIEGCNFALKESNKLICETVESWQINKVKEWLLPTTKNKKQDLWERAGRLSGIDTTPH